MTTQRPELRNASSVFILRLFIFGLFVACLVAAILLQRRNGQIAQLERKLQTRQTAQSAPANSAKRQKLESEIASLEKELITVEYDLAHPPRTLEEKMRQPECQRAMNLSSAHQFARRYGNLFAQLNLSPERLERLRELLAARSADPANLRASRNEDECRERRLQHITENEEEVAAFFTPDEKHIYEAFKQQLPASNMVLQMQNYLVSRGDALDTGQARQLQALLSSGARDGSKGITVKDGMWPDPDRATSLITEDVVARARAFLSLTQLEMLTRMQDLQEAQRRLNARIDRVYSLSASEVMERL